MTEQIDSCLQLLDRLGNQYDLSLQKLSEPLSNTRAESRSQADRLPAEQNVASIRISDASSNGDNGSSSQDPTPASLEADLTHYRDLFTKLRFSYTSQVTKEKFLRTLVSENPFSNHYSSSTNAALESSLAELKTTLQTQKAFVNELTTRLEDQARALSKRQVAVEERTEELTRIPEKIDQLQEEIQTLRLEMRDLLGDGDLGETQGVTADDRKRRPELFLGLEATVGLVEQREEQIHELDQQMQEVVALRARKEKELKKLQDELSNAEEVKDQAIRAASEARKREEEGKSGVDDEVEQQGRWLSGVETTMRGLLHVG